MFFKIGFLNNFANFTGKHQSYNLFLIKLKDFRPANLLKSEITVKFAKFLRTLSVAAVGYQNYIRRAVEFVRNVNTL